MPPRAGGRGRRAGSSLPQSCPPSWNSTEVRSLIVYSTQHFKGRDRTLYNIKLQKICTLFLHNKSFQVTIDKINFKAIFSPAFCCLREAAKRSFFSGPATKALVATIFFGLQNKVFIHSGQALNLPPLSGRTTKKTVFCGFPKRLQIRFKKWLNQNPDPILQKQNQFFKNNYNPLKK